LPAITEVIEPAPDLLAPPSDDNASPAQASVLDFDPKVGSPNAGIVKHVSLQHLLNDVSMATSSGVAHDPFPDTSR
jgi:hypothetical protein